MGVSSGFRMYWGFFSFNHQYGKVLSLSYLRGVDDTNLGQTNYIFILEIFHDTPSVIPYLFSLIYSDGND